MSKFKVGDRVAGYEESVRCVGVVDKINSRGLYSIRCYDGISAGWYHEKQLRRLKPKRKSISNIASEITSVIQEPLTQENVDKINAILNRELAATGDKRTVTRTMQVWVNVRRSGKDSVYCNTTDANSAQSFSFDPIIVRALSATLTYEFEE